ncbi:MAG: hypothetical protein RIQ89_1472 [Bacteroidota bacterium]|jgi:flagellar basal body-associated protein FliL
MKNTGKKKQGRLRHRTRQRMSRKMIIIASTTSIVMLVIGFTFFFNFSNTEDTKASTAPTPAFLMVTDQEFSTDKSVAQPFMNGRPIAGPNTVLMKVAKPLSVNANTTLD